MSLVSFLYKLARAANDIRAIAQPKRLPNRIKNKVVGRIIGKMGGWNKLWK